MLISMVQAGEASGSLEVSLNRMAIQFDKDTKLKATIKKALTYPAVVLVVMFAVILVLLYYVIPTFMSMFADMDIEMPALTMFVMNASDFVQNYWYIILAVVVIIVIAWKTFSSTMTGKIAIGKFTLWCPLSKNFVIKTASARLARTLSTLTAAGISMIEALDITSKTMTNVILRMAVMDAKEDVKKGVPLSEGLKKSGVFPPMLLHMTKIGENTGDMEAMLTKMANYYDEEVENATAQLMAMIEPMITVVMAGLVGVIVGAVLMPMVALYDGLEDI
jgi:type IV pilus assembly protein PilC